IAGGPTSRRRRTRTPTTPTGRRATRKATTRRGTTRTATTRATTPTTRTRATTRAATRKRTPRRRPRRRRRRRADGLDGHHIYDREARVPLELRFPRGLRRDLPRADHAGLRVLLPERRVLAERPRHPAAALHLGAAGPLAPHHPGRDHAPARRGEAL